MPIQEIFGAPEPQREYRLRPSVYAILINPEGQIALVQAVSQTGPRYFLPGGGLEQNERPEEALLREIHEETGYGAHILWHLAAADQYVPAQNPAQGWLKRSQFYLAETDGPPETEGEYPVLWLNPDEAQEKLNQNGSHQSHGWVLSRFSPYLTV